MSWLLWCIIGYVDEKELIKLLGATNGSCDDNEDQSCDTNEEVCINIDHVIPNIPTVTGPVLGGLWVQVRPGAVIIPVIVPYYR